MALGVMSLSPARPSEDGISFTGVNRPSAAGSWQHGMTIVGAGDYRYERVPSWPIMPAGWSLEHPSDAAVNSAGATYVLSRNDPPPSAACRPDRRFVRAPGAASFSPVQH